MKLLFFISSLSSGGAERVTSTLANYWAERACDVSLVTLCDGKRDFYTISPKVQRISLNLLHESKGHFTAVINNMRRLWKIRCVLKELKPNVAVAMMDTSNILLAISGSGLPGMVLLGSERIHPPHQPLNRAWSFLRRHYYGRLSAIVALTYETKEWLLKNTLARRVVVIPNAAPWPISSKEPFKSPEDYVSPDRKLILAIGRLCEQKGFDQLITAFKLISNEQACWDLVILGEGSEKEKLKRQVEEYGLQKRVHFVGHAGNVCDWYKAADLFVLSSRFEGFPNTLIEAMASGVPSISFDCDTGPRDIIRHQVDGWLVPNGDTEKLATTLTHLISNESLRTNLGNAARSIKDRFSLERVAGLWSSFFEELTNAQRLTNLKKNDEV